MENPINNQFGIIDPKVINQLFQICSQVLVNQAEINQKLDLLKEPHPAEILDIKAVSELTKLSVGSIYQKIHKNEIPHHKQGQKLLRFKRSEILAWLLQRPTAKANPIEQAEKILANSRKG